MELEAATDPVTDPHGEIANGLVNVRTAARLLEAMAEQTDVLPSLVTDLAAGFARTLSRSAERMGEAYLLLAAAATPEPDSLAPDATMAVKTGAGEAASKPRGRIKPPPPRRRPTPAPAPAAAPSSSTPNGVPTADDEP